MAVPIKVPSVGESISEGVIARWLKKDGDSVQADEPVFELETEKATGEVPAPAAGVLRIKAAEGATVPIGAVVGEIDTSAKSAPTPTAKPAPVQPARETGDGADKAKPSPKEEKVAAPRPHVSPAARRLAAEEGIAPADITGSGKRGQILKEDVQKAAQERTTQPSTLPAAKPQTAQERETRQRMSAIRQRIANRLVASQQTTASLTTFNEADLSTIIDLRQRCKDRFKEKHGVGLGFMSFFVKACVEALKAYPIANSRIDGEDVVYCNYWNIGVAVSTDKGLMVPVVHDADRMSLAEIEKAIADLAGKARDGKISVTDLQGGTFTITNGGVFGSMLSTPILNPPQSAILGMHAIEQRPVVREGQIVIRPMMYLALTYDHRLIDGRDAVLFLGRVKECVENPGILLLDI